MGGLSEHQFHFCLYKMHTFGLKVNTNWNVSTRYKTRNGVLRLTKVGVNVVGFKADLVLAQAAYMFSRLAILAFWQACVHARDTSLIKIWRSQESAWYNLDDECYRGHNCQQHVCNRHMSLSLCFTVEPKNSQTSKMISLHACARQWSVQCIMLKIFEKKYLKQTENEYCLYPFSQALYTTLILYYMYR